MGVTCSFVSVTCSFVSVTCIFFFGRLFERVTYNGLPYNVLAPTAYAPMNGKAERFKFIGTVTMPSVIWTRPDCDKLFLIDAFFQTPILDQSHGAAFLRLVLSYSIHLESMPNQTVPTRRILALSIPSSY